EVGFGQLAVARQRLVDDLVERRIVASRVDVPDFIVARHGGLPERFDLAKRNFGEGHGAFMLVERLDHVITSPIPGVLPVPAAMIKIIATKLKDENEGPV